MRYILVTILFVLLIITSGAYWLAFTSSGNDVLKPYLEQKISKQVGKEVKLDVLRLKLDKIDVRVLVEKELDVKIQGPVSIFKKSFDLNYTIWAKNLKTSKMLIKEEINLAGQIRGKLEEFSANGKGGAFGSVITFLAKLKDKKPQSLDLNAKGIELASVLELVGKKPYINGKADIVAHAIPQGNDFKTNADITLHKGKVNEKAVFSDFNITLPKNVTYQGVVHATLEHNIVVANLTLKSTLANIDAKKTQYNLNTKKLNSDFLINLPNLANLKSIIKQDLQGEVNVKGDVEMLNDDILINANSDIFNGALKAKLHNNSLNLNLSKMQIAQILTMLKQPKAISGLLNADIDIENIKDMNIKSNINVSNGKTSKANLNKMINYELEDTTFDTNIKANMAQNIVQSDIILNSSLGKVNAKIHEFDTKTQNIKADFDINIEDLKKLESVLKQKLTGSLKANGNFSYHDKKIIADIKSKIFNGEINANINDKIANVDISKINLKNIFTLIGQTPPTSGELNAKANITDMKNLTGTINASIDNAKLIPQGLKKYTELKIPNDISYSLKSDINIKNNIANFTQKLNSSVLDSLDLDGTFDIKKQNLNSKYNINISDLSKLAFVTGKKLIGKLNAKGIIQKENENIKATLKAPFIGGDVDGVYDKNIATLKADNISVRKLLELLEIPRVFESNGNLNAKYNTKTQKGDFNLFMKEGRLTPNKLVSLAATFGGIDLESEVYKNSVFKGVIDKNMVNYDLNMSASKSEILIPRGNYNILTKQVDADLLAKIQKTDVSGKITGNASSPEVKLKSNYLDKKVDNLLDKHIEDNKTKEVIKDLFKLF